MATAARSTGRRRLPVVGSGEPGADLWGRTPKAPHQCQGCGLSAELWAGRFCWLCWHSGQARFVLSGPMVRAADRADLLADPPG